MIPEAAYQVALGALVTVIGILWKLHLDADAARLKAAHEDRDEWRDIAKSMTADVGELGEALTVRNRIDEELLRQRTQR